MKFQLCKKKCKGINLNRDFLYYLLLNYNIRSSKTKQKYTIISNFPVTKMNDGERKFFLRRYFSFNAQTSLTNTAYGSSSNASFNETNELNDLQLKTNLNCNQKQHFAKRSSSLKSINNEYELSKHKIIKQLQSQQSIELESYFKQRITMNQIDSGVNFNRYRLIKKKKPFEIR